MGKANCEYLCLSSNSYTNCTGPVLNPLDTTRTTGGSSSGSAALVHTTIYKPGAVCSKLTTTFLNVSLKF